MTEFDHIATSLARHVLGMKDYESGAGVPAEFGSAEIRMDLRAMVHGISRNIRLHNAALASQVETKLREAVTDEAISRAVAQAVAEEVQRVYRDISRIAREFIDRKVATAMEEALGDGPAKLAKKLTRKLWEQITKIPTKSDRYGYGRDRAHKRGKR